MGKIELDHTGSGGGVTLSSDGTDLLLDGTAIGGGGAALELYAENPVTPTAPSATGTNAVAIGSGAEASATDGIAIGKDSDATGTFRSIGIGRLAQATGISSIALGFSTSSASTEGNALGSRAQVAVGSNATAIAKSYASGTDSFAAAIANNTSSYGATGANSVAIGGANKATGTGGLALGRNAISTVQDAVSIGLQCTADATNSIALGAYSSTKGIKGRIAFSGVSSNYQQGTFVLAKQTADATPSVLTYNTAGASTDNQIILPNNSAYAFHGTIVARQQASAGTACAAWKIEGLIRREGSAGTTVLVNSATTVLDNTPAWGLALSADTTNGGLKIEATGAASTNIRWVATIHTSEVTY